MRYDGENKDNPLQWRLRIGRLFGITVFVHLLFLVGAAIVVAQALMPAQEGYYKPGVLQTFGELGILFLIVLVHEFGHCFGARASGGEAEEILLWPLGGLASVHPQHTPRAHFITTAAGPLVNVIFCVVTGAFLALYAGLGAIPWNPLTALGIGFQARDPVVEWVTVFYALSYIILLFNLLPIYPLDGGRLLHALLWPKRVSRRD
ncbi:MAG TPA: site-2 protease family protein, partial [Phycisphaerae bacterium]|nr:site-2 protease family protein [Phycisphaerae bacterium]